MKIPRQRAIRRQPPGVLAVAWTLLASAAPVVVAQPYQPSLTCRINDNNVELDLFMPLARDGSGNAARGMRGDLKIHNQKMGRDRREWPLDKVLPAQFWNHGTDLKIRLRFAGGEQLVDLVVETNNRSGSTSYIGNFRLETGEGVKVQGRAECTVG